MERRTDGNQCSKRVGIWIRVSTEDQAQGDSPEHHEQRARYYAEAKGWTIVEVYRLDGVSGKAVSNHPETQRMLGHIRSGHISGLIFSKLARLARNTKELLDFAELFRESDADLISLHESIDTSTPAGRLFYTMIAAMAQWEREEIAERVAASVPVRAKLGKRLGGAAPYGYRWVDGKLAPDPTEAPVRRQMYELFAQHRRKKAVARYLNEAGHRTRNGGKFTDTTIDRLLRDPISKGVRRANYTKSLGEKKHWRMKPESEWILSEIEPIVSEELWAQCNAVLDARRGTGRKPGPVPVQLFAGLVVCYCGHKMKVPSNSPKYICKKCKNKIPIVDLEGVYQEQLHGFLVSPEEIQHYVTEGESTVREHEQLLDSLTRERRKLEQDIDHLFSLHREGQIPTEGFGQRYQPLQDRLVQIDEQIPKLQAEVDFLTVNLLSSDKVMYEAQTLADRWSQLTNPERRQIVEAITEQIIVGKDDIAINLCYLPVAPELMAPRQHNFMDSLPWCHRSLSASKPRPPAYPTVLKTIGDHIRKRRIELGLFQKEAAERIGVDKTTVFNWEARTASPNLRAWPKVIQFLGYDPRPVPATPGEQLRHYREGLGLSLAEAARLVGVNPSTLAKWERGTKAPQGRNLDIVLRSFGYLKSVTPGCQRAEFDTVQYST